MDNVKELFVSFFGYNTYVYVAAFITVVIASLKFISWVQKTKKKKLEIIKLKIDILHKKRKDDMLQLDKSEQAEIENQLQTLYDKAIAGKRKRETNISHSGSIRSASFNFFTVFASVAAVVSFFLGMIDFFGNLSKDTTFFNSSTTNESDMIFWLLMVLGILGVVSVVIAAFSRNED